MPEAALDQSLHLPSLVIKNFRGIDELTIPRLGRVTLLAGKNGVGKTTVLDAVRVIAAPGHYSVLNGILLRHEEHVGYLSEQGGDSILPDHRTLFYGRSVASQGSISIGPLDTESQLQLQVSPATEDTDLQLAGVNSAYWTSLHGDGPKLTAQFLGEEIPHLISHIQSRGSRETIRRIGAIIQGVQDIYRARSVMFTGFLHCGVLSTHSIVEPHGIIKIISN